MNACPRIINPCSPFFAGKLQSFLQCCLYFVMGCQQMEFSSMWLPWKWDKGCTQGALLCGDWQPYSSITSHTLDTNGSSCSIQSCPGWVVRALLSAGLMKTCTGTRHRSSCSFCCTSVHACCVKNHYRRSNAVLGKLPAAWDHMFTVYNTIRRQR